MVTLGKAFNGRDLLLTNSAYRGDARPAGTAIDQDRTSAALSFSAPVLAPRQIKLIAQDADCCPRLHQWRRDVHSQLAS